MKYGWVMNRVETKTKYLVVLSSNGTVHKSTSGSSATVRRGVLGEAPSSLGASLW